MIIVTTEQRTPEWYQARVGKLTASRACDMLAMIKSGEAAARRDLRMQLVCERLTGTSQDDKFVNEAMQRGIEKESDALAAYELLTGNIASTVGFLAHDSLPAGCSPDGQIDDYKGLLEIKCPKSSTHLSYVRSGTIPKDYVAQITHAIWVTGAEWCDFVSFDDRFPPALQVFSKRVWRSELDLKAYELLVRMFLAEVDKEVEALTAPAGAAA